MLSSNQNLKDLWSYQLSESQRKDRAERVFRILEKVGDKQLELIKKYEKSENDKEPSFIYLYRTIRSIWDNAEFVLSLGRGKNKKFAFYPARAVMENICRLDYFSKQPTIKQNKIAIREILRFNKRMYDLEIAMGNSGEQYKKYHNLFALLITCPPIEQANPKDDPFPDMNQLINQFNRSRSLIYTTYEQYQALAELSHGKLMSLVMIEGDESGTYRRSVMQISLMCVEALKLIDSHLNYATKNEVLSAIEKAECLISKPIKS